MSTRTMRTHLWRGARSIADASSLIFILDRLGGRGTTTSIAPLCRDGDIPRPLSSSEVEEATGKLEAEGGEGY